MTSPLADLDPAVVRTLLRDWRAHGRPEQHAPPGDWLWWLMLPGRGFGKTTSGSEWFHEEVRKRPNGRGGIVQRTIGEVRDICIEGDDGILATMKPDFTCKYEPSKRRVTWENGFQATTYTSEEPDLLRGPTLSLVWGDEFAAWKTSPDASGATAFDNARFALRGRNPKGLLTTTPKRVSSVKGILKDAALPGNPHKIVITRGSLLDNPLLPQAYIDAILLKYAGTGLGAQEIDGLLASDVEGALWKTMTLNACRVDEFDLPSLDVPIVAVDPSVGDGTGDECGISVQALSAGLMPTIIQQGSLSVVRDMRHGYVLEDASLSGPPEAWAARVVETCQKWGTKHVVVEGNQGQRLLVTVLRNLDPSLRVHVVNAKDGKRTRAEPAAGAFAQGRWHIVGEMPELEDQLTTSTFAANEPSPDRLDAMVWGQTYLDKRVNRKESTSGDGDNLLDGLAGEM